jgi:hypothetical protein
LTQPPIRLDRGSFRAEGIPDQLGYDLGVGLHPTHVRTHAVPMHRTEGKKLRAVGEEKVEYLVDSPYYPRRDQISTFPCWKSFSLLRAMPDDLLDFQPRTVPVHTYEATVG